MSISSRKKNTDFMKNQFRNIHPSFFDDELFETENYNLIDNLV